MFCDVYTPDGEPFDGDPRAVLKRQLAGPRRWATSSRPARAGVLPAPDQRPQKVEPLPHDQAGYFDVTTDLAADVRKEMVNALEEQGIVVEASHHEVAVGQHEIDFKYGRRAADRRQRGDLPDTLKAIAQRHGLYATFMPKPFFGINGSGMHCHQSLADVEPGENLFYDQSDEYGLSDLAKHFIAGQLAHARGMSRDPGAAGELVQAAGAGVRGAGLRDLGAGSTARR